MISLSFLNLGVDIFRLLVSEACRKLLVKTVCVKKRDPKAADASHTGRENERERRRREKKKLETKWHLERISLKKEEKV